MGEVRGEATGDDAAIRARAAARCAPVEPADVERWRRDAKPELRHKLRIGPFIFAGTAVAMVLRHPEWIGMAP